MSEILLPRKPVDPVTNMFLSLRKPRTFDAIDRYVLCKYQTTPDKNTTRKQPQLARRTSFDMACRLTEVEVGTVPNYIKQKFTTSCSDLFNNKSYVYPDLTPGISLRLS
jgi:hypothetical protein